MADDKTMTIGDNPADYTVDQVNAYLVTLTDSTDDETEHDRVIDSERGGQARVGIVGQPDPSMGSTDTDAPSPTPDPVDPTSDPLGAAQEVGVVGDAKDPVPESEPYGDLQGANPDPPAAPVIGSGEQGELAEESTAAVQAVEDLGYLGESQSTAGDLSQANPAVMNRES